MSQRSRCQFSLRTLFVACIWITIVINLTLTMPLAALACVAVPLGWLAYQAIREGRVFHAVVLLGAIAYLAFMLLGAWLENRGH
jgi:hypothetical protein